MGVLIINGTVVNDDSCFEADVYIEGGFIKYVGKNVKIPEATRIIDAAGKLLLPGGIDSFTQLNFKSGDTCTADDFFSGTKAALAGGTTTIFNYLDCTDGDIVQAFDNCRIIADAEVCCNYSLVVGIQSLESNTEEEMHKLTKKGVNSFRISIAERNIKDDALIQIFTICKKLGALPSVHAENGDIINLNQQLLLKNGNYGPEGHLYSRPEEVEEEATNRAIVLAHSCNAPILITNISSKSAAKVIARKREQGCQIYGQPITAALATDGRHYLNADWRHAAAYVMSPPLRLDAETPTHLLQLLSCGALQVTASGHCAFNASQKDVGLQDFTKIPNGVNGIEFRMSLIWEKAVCQGKMNINRFVAVTSTNAAKMFNIYPQKGRIAMGSDADLLIWDPQKSKVISSQTHIQAGDVNIFEGIQVNGVPIYVFVNGKLVVENGEVSVDRGTGQFLTIPPFSPHVFSCMKTREFPLPIIRQPPNSSLSPKEAEKKDPTDDSRKEFHARPPTKSGARNLLDSTFSLSGTQIDENVARTTGVKVIKPPSTSLW